MLLEIGKMMRGIQMKYSSLSWYIVIFATGNICPLAIFLIWGLGMLQYIEYHNIVIKKKPSQ